MSRQNQSFVFLESWYTMIKGYEDVGDLAMAEKLSHQIIKYGITGTTTTDNPVISSMVMAMCAPIIDQSKKRYAACVSNGKKGGKAKEFNSDQIIALSKQGMSNQEIANQLKCSVRTVQRALNEQQIDDVDDEI